MKDCRKILRDMIIRLAETSIPTTSRSGFYQSDMRTLRQKLKKKG